MRGQAQQSDARWVTARRRHLTIAQTSTLVAGTGTAKMHVARPLCCGDRHCWVGTAASIEIASRRIGSVMQRYGPGKAASGSLRARVLSIGGVALCLAAIGGVRPIPSKLTESATSAAEQVVWPREVLAKPEIGRESPTRVAQSPTEPDVDHAPAVRGHEPEWLGPVQHQLVSLGATYIRLDFSRGDPNLYHFHCDLAPAGRQTPLSIHASHVSAHEAALQVLRRAQVALRVPSTLER